MTIELTEEQVRGDLAYAKAALDRETARALRFGKRVIELEAALEPFAALGRYFIDEDFSSKPDDRTVWGFDKHELTYGDFRTAAKAEGR